MNVTDAIKSFKEEYPDKKVKGYWNDGDAIVLNVEQDRSVECPEPCQFIVTGNGSVVPTNPVRSPIIIDAPMTKI